MGVYELSGAGSVKTGRTLYTSMNANNQFGAMVLISSVVVSSTGSVILSNIPATFQDLMLVVSARTDSSTLTSALLRFNGDSGSNYSSTMLLGNGSSATSERYSNESFVRIGYAIGSSQLASVYSSQAIHILNYANTTTNKTVIARNASDVNGSGITQLSATLWRNTAAISSITYATSVVAGSTLTLYGIRAVSS
jgi:hypothetical protein